MPLRPCPAFKVLNASVDVRLGVRPDVRAARVSSAAPKKKSFDRGGPVWPPRSNVTNDCLRGGSGGAKPPQTPPLTDIGRGGAAPRTPRVFFFRLRRHARRPDVRPDVRPNARPPEPKKLSRCTSYDSEYDFTILFFFSKPIVLPKI